MDFRVGSGYDVHKFDDNLGHQGDSDVMICGVSVKHDRAVIAHSDGDVGLHALVDAILGALARGDIGMHFPPSDEKYKDMDSSIFLSEACKMLHEDGYRVVNVDMTIVCERPKISKYRDAMRLRVAEIMSIDKSCVSVKATTEEGMGFTGRREGLAAYAVVLIQSDANG